MMNTYRDGDIIKLKLWCNSIGGENDRQGFIKNNDRVEKLRKKRSKNTKRKLNLSWEHFDEKKQTKQNKN